MFYQESKTAKGAAIGTIMPWGGGITSIPKGWIICDGQFADASAYPLLTQTIGDTYNTGVSSLGGSFPSYSGTIKMPDLNQKTLMDIEEAYFAGGGSPTGRNADEDTDARTLLSPKIGTHESQSITTAFTDVYTDIVFTLPATDATGYQGRIIGNTKIDGDGFKTLYIGPRKLGRKHIARHKHPGSYPTIQQNSATQPGQGVIPFGEVEYTLRFQAVDNQWGGTIGDTYYWGWTDDRIGAQDWDPAYNWYDTADNFTAPGISVGSTMNSPPGPLTGWYPTSTQAQPTTTGSYGSQDNLYQLWWPDDTNTVDTEHIGFGNVGASGVVLAKVESTPPPYDLTPLAVTNSPISSKLFSVTPDHPNGPRLDSATTYKYGLFGAQDELPSGYRNYYLDAGTTTLPYGTPIPVTPATTSGTNALRSTIMNHPGYNFTNSLDNGNDHIRPHDHEEIDIEFDSSRLRSASSLIANVNIPTQADFLGNADNTNALQIDFNVSQPQMTCVYIIRAY
jgi:hypothetical protein